MTHRTHKIEKMLEKIAGMVNLRPGVDAETLESELETVIRLISEDETDSLDLPESGNIVTMDNFADVLREANVVTEEDAGAFVREDDLKDMLEDYLPNDELEDALESLDVVTTKFLGEAMEPVENRLALVEELTRRGFFGRLKWVLLGR